METPGYRGLGASRRVAPLEPPFLREKFLSFSRGRNPWEPFKDSWHKGCFPGDYFFCRGWYQPKSCSRIKTWERRETDFRTFPPFTRGYLRWGNSFSPRAERWIISRKFEWFSGDFECGSMFQSIGRWVLRCVGGKGREIEILIFDGNIEAFWMMEESVIF